jgi:eukaryotic-like serine/threonine-protein kinase
VTGEGDTDLDETGDDHLRELLGMSVRRAPAALTPGQIIDGAYRVDGEIGAGGMGRLYRAHDIRLERDVAIKLHALAITDDDDALRKEGVALAKLAHPNVVTVYEVGTWAGHPWVAMEYVPGGTARTWLRESKRSSAEILALYVAAGRGLAAAHAAGLVHRDFKPDNVLVGTDGRVRVADFGLARELSAAADAGPQAGTPAYMAPEQRDGGAIDARADQYAFAVALWEALDGARPFEGATVAELAANAASGRIVAPSSRLMPRHVELALRRALAPEPGDRWPSMDALLVELDRDPLRRRRRILQAVAAGLGVLVLVAFARFRAGATIEPCQGSQAAIDTSWSSDRRASVAAHLATLTTTYAQQAVPQLTADLDRYASGWVALHRGACLAHQRGEVSPAQFDRRAACLAVRRTALGTVAELATRTTTKGMADLVAAASGLPELAACEDDAALLSPVTPPTSAQAAEAAAIADLIARADVQRDAAHTDEATRDADAALGRARALGYAPLVARSLLARGRVEQAVWRGDRGASAFTTATTLALSAGDEPLAVEAYARAAWATGTTGDGPRTATDGLALIEAVTERIGARAPFPRALLHNNVGGLALSRGDRAAARVAFEQARRESAGLGGSAAIELTAALTNLQLVLDDPAARAAVGEEAIALRTRLLGAHHPLTLAAKLTAAGMFEDPARVRAELTPPCVELHELHPDQRQRVGECAFELTWLAAFFGDQAAVRAMVAHVIAVAPNDASDELRPQLARAYGLLADRDFAAARAAIRKLRPVVTDKSPWWVALDGVDVAIASALASEAAGERAETLVELARAAPLLAQIATAMAPAPLHRRQRAVETIRGRTR